jgi:sulfate adenylyltransferase
MVLRERYPYDKERKAREVYSTTDPEHPGVDYLYRQGEVLLGGEIDLLHPPDRGPFP